MGTMGKKELWGKKVKNKFTLGPKQQNIFHLPGFEANPFGRLTNLKSDMLCQNAHTFWNHFLK